MSLDMHGKVSLWLGTFKDESSFKNYIEGRYDADGNYIISEFQRDFAIERYDIDSAESDWIDDKCDTVKELLEGFSYDTEVIPQFEKLIPQELICSYNSILLLYDFEYSLNEHGVYQLNYIGVAEI